MTQQTALADGQGSVPSWTPPPREALDVPVFFDPAPAVERYRLLRRSIIGRVIGLVVSLVLWGVIGWLNRANLDALFWTILGLSVGLSVVLLVRSIVQTVLAKRALGRLHDGLALGIGRGGLHLDNYLAWEDVDRLVAVPGGSRGSGRLIIVATNGAWREAPIDWLSHTPSAVDAAVRALSGNRHHIDLTPLDA
ncbi:MAG: hypothetical protein Q4F65_08300 [Propionibacteriaceae bacterium]|nr:hypothetical protein [Propionibacteriaceae bacterium]